MILAGGLQLGRSHWAGFGSSGASDWFHQAILGSPAEIQAVKTLGLVTLFDQGALAAEA